MPLNLAAEISDAPMVGRMRLAIALTMLLTFLIDKSNFYEVWSYGLIVLAIYSLHSLVLCIASEFRLSFLEGKLIHWLDVIWFTLIVLFNGGIHSIFFLSFIFAILIASFRWGVQEGARVAIASAILLAACGLVFYVPGDIPILLLRMVFLLSLGYMSAHWGESSLRLKRQLVLLRNVSKLSNPRFGVNQTINRILQKTLSFFNGDSCILIMQDDATKIAQLRLIKKDQSKLANADQVDDNIAQPLLAFMKDSVVLYRNNVRNLFSKSGVLVAYDNLQKKWHKEDSHLADDLSTLLETQAFISVPIILRNGAGRLYVTSSHPGFDKEDALFLNHICAQAFPVIENIELLDQIASKSAIRERQKISRDLHDTTIQPYIGLQLSLCALQKKAATDNPLAGDLNQLISMSTEVISGLRRFARTFESEAESTTKIMEEVVSRYAQQAREFYGISITVSFEGNLDIKDRLAAEVMQIVSEGLSNIRKHTAAKSGSIRIACINDMLEIDIQNEGDGTLRTEFIPKTITQRVIVLGGKTYVAQHQDGSTIIHVKIPT